MDVVNKVLAVEGAILVVLLALVFVQGFYFTPLASEVANKVCQGKGFDQEKSFSTVLFSTMPLGVKCEYAPRSTQVEPQI
jgi:hypothetical protein